MKPRYHSPLNMLPVFAFLLLTTTTVAQAQTITASPNPVSVPAGQTEGKVTVVWNTEGLGGFVWMTVDGGDETQVAAGVVKGSAEIIVALGKSYAFKLYDAGKERVLAAVEVKVVEQAAPPSGGSGGIKNPKNATRDTNAKVTMKGSVYGQKPRELRCRGSADLKVELSSSHIIYMKFTPARLPIDLAGRNLQPGECGWTDRPMNVDDGALVYQAIKDIKGLWKPDPSVPDTDRFPKYEVVREYLRDPNNYWSFFVRDIGRKELWAEYSRRWIPFKSSTIKSGVKVTQP